MRAYVNVFRWIRRALYFHYIQYFYPIFSQSTKCRHLAACTNVVLLFPALIALRSDILQVCLRELCKRCVWFVPDIQFLIVTFSERPIRALLYTCTCCLWNMLKSLDFGLNICSEDLQVEWNNQSQTCVTTTELIVEQHSSVLPGNNLLYNVSLTRFLNRLYVFIANQFFGFLIP